MRRNENQYDAMQWMHPCRNKDTVAWSDPRINIHDWFVPARTGLEEKKHYRNLKGISRGMVPGKWLVGWLVGLNCIIILFVNSNSYKHAHKCAARDGW
jgi:hypothetical protein